MVICFNADEADDMNKDVNPLDIRHSKQHSTFFVYTFMKWDLSYIHISETYTLHIYVHYVSIHTLYPMCLFFPLSNGICVS